MHTVVRPDTLIRWHCEGWRLFGAGSGDGSTLGQSTELIEEKALRMAEILRSREDGRWKPMFGSTERCYNLFFNFLSISDDRARALFAAAQYACGSGRSGFCSRR